jgi:hypothetical protein
MPNSAKCWPIVLVGERPLKCDACGNRYKPKQNLAMHQRTCHQLSSAGVAKEAVLSSVSHPCPDCVAKFTTVRKLRRHIQLTHEGMMCFS